MRAGKCVVILLFCLCDILSHAQIQQTSGPRDKEFIARDRSTNAAYYSLQGKISDKSIANFKIELYKDGSLEKTHRPSLKSQGGHYTFEQRVRFEGGKHFYSIKYVASGSRTYTLQIDSILVGDAYLIQGQSNAVAASYSQFDKSYYSPYLRSFGTSQRSPLNARTDTGWYEMQAERVYTKGAIGQWGAVMARQILDSFSMPVCILNGAVGGTPVNYHLADPNDHYNTNTNYGRLLTRAKNAGLDQNISGIFYFQGESDGPRALKHDTMFRQIVKDWKLDFKDFSKLYVIQVREGCGGPSLELREVQRQFGRTISRCQTVSANGLNGHDGCHYRFKEGYELLGKQLAALVGRDLYGSERKNVDPPDINMALFNNASHTEVKLIMERPEDLIYADSGFQNLFEVTGDTSVRITHGLIRNNEVVLKLSKSSCLPLSLNYNGAIRRQAWVKSQGGMGLLTFFNVPIQPHHIKRSHFACLKQEVELGADSIPGYTYTWLNRNNGKSNTMARWKVSLDSNTEFRLIIGYDPGLCRPFDTISVNVAVDPVRLPEFDDHITLCENDSLALAPENKGYSIFKWNGQTSWTYLLDTVERVHWNGMSMAGCRYSDSMDVNVSEIHLDLEDSLFVCPGKDTLIQISNQFRSYWWNDVIGGNESRRGEGKVHVMVIDSNFCTERDSIFIASHLKPLDPEWRYRVCKSDSLTVLRPSEVVSWKDALGRLGDSLLLGAEITKPIEWTDGYGCQYFDTLIRLDLPLPMVAIPGDTTICEKDSLNLDFGSTAYRYIWNDTSENLSQRVLAEAGNYHITVIDSNNCSVKGAFRLDIGQRPSLSAFMDTVLCEDSTWVVPLQDSVNYLINGTRISGFANIYADSTYLIHAKTANRCSTTKKIEVGLKSCIASANALEIEDVKVYPNPAREYIEVSCPPGLMINRIVLLDLSGRYVLDDLYYGSEAKVDCSSFTGIYKMRVSFDNGYTRTWTIHIE